MSDQKPEQYVVHFQYQEKNLSELLELNSALTLGGFSTTLNDRDGHPHELGSNSFGITSTLSQEELAGQARAMAEQVLGSAPEVTVTPWQELMPADKS